MSMLCVIPVRGGSKRVLAKNLRQIEGRPLVVWTIEQALAVDRLAVFVSPDCQRTAERACAARLKVPWMERFEPRQLGHLTILYTANVKVVHLPKNVLSEMFDQ